MFLVCSQLIGGCGFEGHVDKFHITAAGRTCRECLKATVVTLHSTPAPLEEIPTYVAPQNDRQLELFSQ